MANSPKLTTVSFQIQPEKFKTVKRQAIELNYPLMEEYNFQNDTFNPNISMDLKPLARKDVREVKDCRAVVRGGKDADN